MLTFGMTLGITTGLTEGFHWKPGNAYNVALVTVILVSFPIMRHRVYESPHGDARKQLGLFALATVLFRFAERLAFEGLHEGLGVQYQLSIFVIAGAFSLTKYFIYGLTLFRPRHG